MSLELKAAPVADAVYERISTALQSFKKKGLKPPTLVTVLVGEDPASAVYVRKKGEMALKLGLGHKDFKLPTSVSQEELVALVEQQNKDPNVDGILVQLPLPKQINERAILDLVDPAKDVDCFSAHNVGLLSQGRGVLAPCTPAGVMEILKHYKIETTGKNALIVGRSDIVGKPMAMLLLHSHCTVTIAHSRTKNMDEHLAKADIVVAAIGKAKFLGGTLPWKKDAVVIDVGINRQSDGKLCGDVDFAAVAPKVQAITPVPGGVGPMTIAMLMWNTLRAGAARKGVSI